MKKHLKLLLWIPAALLFLWLILSSYGAFNNFLSWDARQAHWAWKLVGSSILVFWLIFVVNLLTHNIKQTKGNFFLVIIILAVAVGANAGFLLTGGDKKQRMTCFIDPVSGKPSLDGKVDPACLWEHYRDFYKLEIDTALWNYVNTYKELPGVNHWAFNIREGKTPRSTAPRADEDFQYHTGAYENYDR